MRLRTLRAKPLGDPLGGGERSTVHGPLEGLEVLRIHPSASQDSLDVGLDRRLQRRELLLEAPLFGRAIERFSQLRLGHGRSPPYPRNRPIGARSIPPYGKASLSCRAPLGTMPLAITIETVYGPVGVVHAEAPHHSWAESLRRLETASPSVVDDVVLGFAAPEASRRHRSRAVAGLRALVLGHKPVEHVECVANRWNIDTGAGIPHLNRLSLVEVNTSEFRTRTFDIDESS